MQNGTGQCLFLSLQLPMVAGSEPTPACDGERIYIAGMRDVLVCLDANQGTELGESISPQQFSTPLPPSGSSVLHFLTGMQCTCKRVQPWQGSNKKTGEVLWRALQDEGGMNGSAFSSPVIAELAGKTSTCCPNKRVLGRPRFRNRRRTVEANCSLISWHEHTDSGYFRRREFLRAVIKINPGSTRSCRIEGQFTTEESWSNNAKGYMSTPVVIDGHAYMHLQNERFACINLESGERTWTSEPYGKYCSMIANGNRILALESGGRLLLINANPQEFKLIDELTVSDSETWAHLAISGDQIFVRELDGLAAFRWK